ncbi:MAG TPA: group 1 truncated hemoglobin [Gammaproteobacteria bacterium]|jgi:hemoglobin
MKTIQTSVALLLAALLCAACVTAPSHSPTLYAQMGGQGGIENITDDFLTNLAADSRIAHFFADTDIPKFRSMLIKQFCAVAAGPCTYDGKSMYDAHQNRNIKDADFNALVEDLQKAMDDAHVAQGVQARFLAQLVPMQPDIVNH